MKQLFLLCCVLACFPIIAFSQPCLPQGILFTSQSQIDNFQNNYPECTAIAGSVYISGSDISNLNGLSCLNSIGGNFVVANNPVLTSLAGLEGLNYIWGNLHISNNDLLTNLSELEGLIYILGNLEVDYNDGLTTLTGLNALNSVWEDLKIKGNALLNNLTGLDTLNSVGGNLEISFNNALTSLTGMNNLSSIGGGLSISSNAALTSTTGLGNLLSVGGDLSVTNNAALTSLTALENVTAVGGWLWIANNDALIELTGLAGLTHIGGILVIFDNFALTSLSGLDNIDPDSISELQIISNATLSTCDVQSVCEYLAGPDASVEIYSNATGCNSQEEVEYACGVGLAEILKGKDCIVFPNPSSDHFTVSFTLDHSTPVSLEVINRFGQVVDVILNGNMPKGEHQVIWNAKELPSGIYFYRLTVDNHSSTGKVMVVM